ncbi:biotin-dependent carboxyltransferase family protein [Jannaschia sp. M317]|uniref:5-oxoprolinase subunit C family protein n=1 Tax=Jannaschia sp. M317 TaxID=2867011 RepID=UPI0021A79E3F|nr:urea amidolyase [Jannaschia sp. M317]UWQ17124.1 urea amidolyase [Jannaschia sp. M317]
MIEVLSCGPLVTVQDLGRPGWMSEGLARGGAADRRAIIEARALLGGDPGAGLETPGSPLRLRFEGECQIALTGAPMQASVEGRALVWPGSHVVSAGEVLDLRPMGQGVYSYVHVQGGLRTETIMGSRAVHMIAGIGAALSPGDRLPCVTSTGVARTLSPAPDRFRGGEIRVTATPQTRLFPASELARFEATTFRRGQRGNRQGVQLEMDGAGFAAEGQLSILSDFILPGDIQMTGDGVPYVLGAECQTTGGYPRIGTIVPDDLPRALQAPPGAEFWFRFVDADDLRALDAPRAVPLVRDPADVADLLSMQLISGVVNAADPEDVA